MFVFAAIVATLLQSKKLDPDVQAFLSFHQNVLAVKTTRGWHDPTDSTRFSTKPYLVGSAGIGKADPETGSLSVYKDSNWGWIADADKSLPFDQVLYYGVRPRYLRKVVTTGDPKGIYREAALAIFRSRNFPVKWIEELQICRADVRGDGKEEALVAAQVVGETNPACVVFLRQLTAKGVSTEVLEYQIMGSPRISAIADFVGDGTLQAVIAGGISDGVMASLWSFKSVRPKKLAGFVWGD